MFSLARFSPEAYIFFLVISSFHLVGQFLQYRFFPMKLPHVSVFSLICLSVWQNLTMHDVLLAPIQLFVIVDVKNSTY